MSTQPPLKPATRGRESALSPKLQALLLIATSIGLTAVFWTALWQGQGLVGGDIYAYYLPQKAYYAECLRAGTLPLWNNRIGNGYPQLAESQTGVFYPFNLLLYGWLDLNTAYNASVLLHYSLAFAGGWLLARRFDLGLVASALAALVYTYGWFPPRISLEWTIVGGAWLPWALLCVESYLQQPRRSWLVLLTVVLALQLLAGHFLIAFLTQLLIVGYVLLRLSFADRGLHDAARPTRRAACLCLATAVAGSYLLAAVQLVPTWELKRLSQRGGSNAQHDPAYGSVPVKYLAQVVAPWAWYPDREAYMALHEPQVRKPNPVDAHLYFGLLPLALVPLGLWEACRAGHRRLLLWLPIGVAAVLYMPGWFLPITRHLPGFNFFEGPGRYGLLATLAAALFAGAGFQTLAKWIKPLLRPLFAVAALSITTIDLLWVSDLVHDAEPVEKPPIKLLPESKLFLIFAPRPAEPIRVFNEEHNIPSLIGAGTLPVYLGFSPAAYYDPQLAMPKPYPFREIRPTGEQLDWLRRMGVTHILSVKVFEDEAWPADLLWYGIDPCFGPLFVIGPTQVILMYELLDSRGRIAWQDADSGPPPRIVKYEPQRVEIAAASERGGTLVLTDLDYPGWQVTIDGQPAKGLVIDGMLRGVEVPPGDHVVAWIYRPASFYWGAGISVLTLVGLVASVIRRRSNSPVSGSIPRRS